MLFMDALELDMVEEGDSLPDLRPENMTREIRKAYTAFSAGGSGEVRSGLWGCGAFGGDPGVKMLLLWIAASLAATELVIICDASDQKFAEDFSCLVSKVKEVVPDTVGLLQLLDQIPKVFGGGSDAILGSEQLEDKQPYLGTLQPNDSQSGPLRKTG